MRVTRISRLALAALAILVWLLAVPSAIGMSSRANIPSSAQRTIQVLGHRGAAGLAPENTLAAFRKAIEIGVDWLEFDVQRSADGQLVVIHDTRVDRTTDGVGAVGELTLNDLRTLDAGAKFGQEFAGERIPTLAEVVAMARDANVRVFPETKSPQLYPGIERQLVDELVAATMLDRSIVQSFDGSSLQRLREQGPDLKLAILGTPQRPFPDSTIAQYVGPPWETVLAHPDLVSAAHAAGRQVFVWTLDDPSIVQQLIDAGIDGIITNRPDLIKNALITAIAESD